MRRSCQTPYRETDPIPNNPKSILTGKAETPAEIAKRTGLNLDRLCEQLIAWTRTGHIQHGLYGTPGVCHVPVFRIAPCSLKQELSPCD
ncbi:MAG: hypothetical protein ACK5YR_09260 [Pirellula sp.]|jgi:hypothetical protein